MKSIKKTTYLVAITLVIAGLMITSTAVIATPMNNKTQKTIVGIPTSQVSVAQATMPLQKMSITPSTPSNTLSRGTDFPVFTSDLTNQNPGIVTDGLGTILVATEETDGSTTNLWGRWSTDGGTTWIDPTEATGWQFTTKPTLPELDYYGAGKQAWGTMVPGYDESGTAYYIGLPDITDPTVTNPNNPDGWSAWTVDWSASQLLASNIDSSDVACYSNTSHIPTPEFFGIVAFTGDEIYPGWAQDSTMMFSYFVPGGSSRIIFFNATEDVFNMKTDIDQSNGKFYMVMDYENSPTLTDGSEILYTTITTSDTWWQSGWGGFDFEGVFNTDIVANNKNCYIVGEVDNGGQRDIVCLHSSNSGGSFTQSDVSTDVANEKNPTVTLAETEDGIVLVCSYVRDGNLYISTSSDSGVTWEEQADPINDVDGTVVDQYNTQSIDGPYAAWTDEQNTPTEIYFDISVAPKKNPVLDITSIKGGMHVSAVVSNTGEAAATNVVWTMKVTGGILKRINKTYTDTILTLAAGGGQETIQSTGLILGLGAITITISAACDEGASKQVSASGKVLLFFIKI